MPTPSSRRFVALLVIALTALARGALAQNALVFQSDYGLKDGAVAEMKGVAYGINRDLKIFDVTHEIPAYNIWEAAYRLRQSAPYWPSGTVFVSIVDPGVGTSRKSVVMRSKTGHFFVTPDNGTLTLVAEDLGIDEVREIDETRNRLPGSEKSYTFHGRDVYAYTGARLAAGIIGFAQVGPRREGIVTIPYTKSTVNGKTVSGTIPILDVQYGNIWTNIADTTFQQIGGGVGTTYHVRVSDGSRLVWEGDVPYTRSFGDVHIGRPLLYINSLLNVALALNQGSFASVHHVKSGPSWKIQITRR